MRKQSDLFLHQRITAELIIENPRLALFQGMGMGKTAATLTAIDTMMFATLDISSVLVVGTKRVVESVWAQEAAQWEHLQHLTFSLIAGSVKQRIAATKNRADVHLISRDNLVWLCALYGGRLPYDMLVIDESSSFKNHTSQRFKSAKLATPSIPRVVELTGTPSPRGAINLWSQMYLLDQGARLGKTITQFREAFLYAESGQGHIVYKYGCTQDSYNTIIARIEDITVSMKQEDYIDVPDFVENEIKIQMPSDIRKQYKSFERDKVLELFGEGQTITAANSAALSNKLLQYANGALYDEGRNVHEVHTLKLDALEEVMEGLQGKSLLVAYTYISDAERILNRFAKKYRVRQLSDDKDVVDWNSGEIDMLIMHPASGGHGLNLQFGGHHILWFGNSWDLELVQQLNHRLKRPGQTEKVVISKLILEGSEDERVINSQKQKDRSQNYLIEAVKFKLQEYLTSRESLEDRA